MGALPMSPAPEGRSRSRHVTSIKRYESASPARLAKAHALEQKALIKLAFA